VVGGGSFLAAACTPQQWAGETALHGVDVLLWLQVNELTKLDMSHNELVQLPAQLWSLVALNTLLLRCGEFHRRACRKHALFQVQACRMCAMRTCWRADVALPEYARLQHMQTTCRTICTTSQASAPATAVHVHVCSCSPSCA
jgi:hypothetical protein